MASPSRAGLERYDGALRVTVTGGRYADLHFTPPMRLFRPHLESGEPRSIVIANVAGGVVGGDRLDVAVTVGAGEALFATTQAAEKVYRSDGHDAVLTNTFSVADGGVLEMLSAGTILFDGSRLDRTTTINVEGGGRFAYAETVVFGRIARGEVFQAGRLRDRIRLHRDGRLAWADDFGLDGPISARMQAAAGLGGARSLATLMMVGPGAEAVIAIARNQQADAGLRIGASAISEGVVVVRILGPDAAAARVALTRIWTAARSAWLDRPARMPVIWSV